MKPRTVYPFWTWFGWVVITPLVFVLAAGAILGLTRFGDIPFDNPDLVWLLALVPIAGLLFIYGRARRQRALTGLTSTELAPLLAARISPARQAARAGLMVLAVAFLVAAVLGPRWGMYLQKQKVRGVDIVVALDVSRSMLADDVAPNRFARAKQEIRQQLLERPRFAESHRMALLAFAGSTSLKVPLTTDRLTFRNKLETLRVGSAPRGGTNIDKALRAAADLFVKSPEEATKLILVFTDGEGHEGVPVETAQALLSEKNIRVHTIGVGDPSRTVGAQVPAAEGGKPLLHDGQFVYSKVNVDLLRKVAEAGGGDYAPVEDLHVLVSNIAAMRQSDLTTEERMRHKPQYQWLVALALVCLGLEIMMREGRPAEGNVMRRVWQTEEAV